MEAMGHDWQPASMNGGVTNLQRSQAPPKRDNEYVTVLQRHELNGYTTWLKDPPQHSRHYESVCEYNVMGARTHYQTNQPPLLVDYSPQFPNAWCIIILLHDRSAKKEHARLPKGPNASLVILSGIPAPPIPHNRVSPRLPPGLSSVDTWHYHVSRASTEVSSSFVMQKQFAVATPGDLCIPPRSTHLEPRGYPHSPELLQQLLPPLDLRHHSLFVRYIGAAFSKLFVRFCLPAGLY